MTQMAMILILSIPNFTNHFEQIGDEHNDGDNGLVRPTAAVDPFVRETFENSFSQENRRLCQLHDFCRTDS